MAGTVDFFYQNDRQELPFGIFNQCESALDLRHHPPKRVVYA